MNEVDRAGLYAEISKGSIGCETKDCKNVATDFIVQPLGFNDKVKEEIVVPICKECIKFISGDEWVLLYCVQCLSSQWLSRSLAKRTYDSSIVWMDGCPKCSE